MDGHFHTDAADPFAPLGEGAQPEAGSLPEPEIWEPQFPAPGEPPEAGAIRHFVHGHATQRWVYRDAEGRPLFVIARFDLADGRKETLPFTFGRRVWTTKSGNRRDQTAWHFKRPRAPVPLYGLDRLAAAPSAPVLLVEGEKAADAAALLFPDMAAVTSQGGSKAASKADWKPLAGRDVVIWPDRDDPGAAYADDAARLIKQAGAASVRQVQVPRDWPEGWDLADPLPENVTTTELLELLAGAPDADPPDLPRGYRFTPNGLFFFPEPTEKNPDPAPIFVSAPFDVVGEANDGTGNNWGLVLRWRDRDGRRHEWSVPKRLVHADGNAIAAELEDAGLSCGSDGRAHVLLKNFIGAVKGARRLRCVDRTGWHVADGKPVFILPGGEAYGPAAGHVILQTERAGTDAAFVAAGSLADWQQQVARYAEGNDRLVLFLAASFAGPLLDVASEPSGGFHMVGKSQSGKSTSLFVAGSVWGRGDRDGQVRQWRATSNGLEGVAAETSDTVLILDEMGQANAIEVADTVYMLANGSGKARAGRGGEARRRKSWRSLFLSTGEVTLAAKMADAGKRVMAGLEVRLVNLPADAGAGMGVFQQLHDLPNPAALANHLRDAARTHYGTAARAFLAKLAKDRAEAPEELRAFVAAMRETFIAEQVAADADGQVRSVAGRFALIGAAGELAQSYGVLPWQPNEAMRAAAACFQVWLAERGGSGSGEDAQAVAQVRGFIEAHGASRFELVGGGIDTGIDPRTVNRAGFRRKDGDGWEYLVLPEVWRNEVCRGLDPKRAADTLAAEGFLLGSTERARAASERIPGHGRLRVYVISGKILEGGHE
ncbi:DUF927 domain-containing protein [Roseomonas mucosa]|uniref:DUF927 domain-containing protein n=1 Tax=Roseomonas mucosa TaxID=207340 RepID=UPI0028CE68D9|nr:DUF927 domain-containing protein [Roseomonas mucosa]MDT8277677.1 DUF927 domain-containing protein [Roseomonas mucosa]